MSPAELRERKRKSPTKNASDNGEKFDLLNVMGLRQVWSPGTFFWLLVLIIAIDALFAYVRQPIWVLILTLPVIIAAGTASWFGKSIMRHARQSESDGTNLAISFIPFYALFWVANRPDIRGPVFRWSMTVTAYVLFVPVHFGMFFIADRVNNLYVAPFVTANVPEQLDVSNESLRGQPRLGPTTELKPGVRFNSVTTTGSSGIRTELYIYRPAQMDLKSLPCVLTVPGGTSGIVGAGLGDRDDHERLSYVRAGCVVVAYELTGEAAAPIRLNVKEYAGRVKQFIAAQGGLVNARQAATFASKYIPEVDPERIYIAGNGSGGTHALLAAQHLSEIKGVIAYAPLLNLQTTQKSLIDKLTTEIPDINRFAEFLSPVAHVSKFNCPVFLFQAKFDIEVPVEAINKFADQLHRQQKRYKLQIADSSSNYSSIIEEGIPSGINWLASIDGKLPADIGTKTTQAKQTLAQNSQKAADLFAEIDRARANAKIPKPPQSIYEPRNDLTPMHADESAGDQLQAVPVAIGPFDFHPPQEAEWNVAATAGGSDGFSIRWQWGHDLNYCQLAISVRNDEKQLFPWINAGAAYLPTSGYGNIKKDLCAEDWKLNYGTIAGLPTTRIERYDNGNKSINAYKKYKRTAKSHDEPIPSVPPAHVVRYHISYQNFWLTAELCCLESNSERLPIMEAAVRQLVIRSADGPRLPPMPNDGILEKFKADRDNSRLIRYGSAFPWTLPSLLEDTMAQGDKPMTTRVLEAMAWTPVPEARDKLVQLAMNADNLQPAALGDALAEADESLSSYHKRGLFFLASKAQPMVNYGLTLLTYEDEKSSVQQSEVVRAIKPHLLRSDGTTNRRAVPAYLRWRNKGAIDELKLLHQKLTVSQLQQDILDALVEEDPSYRLPGKQGLLLVRSVNEHAVSKGLTMLADAKDVDEKLQDAVLQVIEPHLADNDRTRRHSALHALGRWADDRSLSRLEQMLRSDDHRSDRNAIIKALGMSRQARVVPTIMRYLSTHANDVRDALIEIGPEAESSVARLTTNRSSKVRHMAVQILGAIGTNKTLSALRRLANNQRFPETAELARRAIEQIQFRANHPDLATLTHIPGMYELADGQWVEVEGLRFRLPPQFEPGSQSSGHQWIRQSTDGSTAALVKLVLKPRFGDRDLPRFYSYQPFNPEEKQFLFIRGARSEEEEVAGIKYLRAYRGYGDNETTLLYATYLNERMVIFEFENLDGKQEVQQQLHATVATLRTIEKAESDK